MPRTLNNIKLGLDDSLEESLRWLAPDYGEYRIRRQSVDARQRHSPHFVYSVDVYNQGESAAPARVDVPRLPRFGQRPVVIVGAGPAGLFAALRLSERGIPCVLLEQGSATAARVKAIGRYWRYGELDSRTNVGFGEGGAGLFSDGKLITRIKSAHIPYVMQRLVQYGAPAEIEYLANPHVGSDRIRRVIPKMREHVRELGGEIRFDARVSELITAGSSVTGVRLDDGEVIEAERVILATGHSAEGIFTHLRDAGVFMEGKSFAVGLRIEHPQAYINEMQYREHAAHPRLGAANYRLAYTDEASKTGVYSFCMCPGGYVLSCATEGGGVVSNGMSNFNRNSRFANAAMVVSLNHEARFGNDGFGGLAYRRDLEARAYGLVTAAGGGRELPAQRLMDFLEGRAGEVGESSSPSGVVATRLDTLFDADFKKHFYAGLQRFERNMPGFITDQAVLHGVESRTSCPVRVTRDPATLQSVSHSGLYPTGEGAGYAGGITSAACDGIRVADAIAAEVSAEVALVM